MAQRAVDLVGADVQEAEGGFLGFWQDRPVGADGFEHAEGADDIGLDKVFGTVDRAIHVAFGREVKHGAGLVFGQQAIHQHAVAQIALHKHMARIALQAGEVFGVTGMSEFVEVDDRLVGLSQPVQREVAADEGGAAGNQNYLLEPP